jgi:uncharacterized protein YegL
MRFVPSSHPQQQPTLSIHFVMLLDESASMWCNPWNQLLEAVENALEKISGTFSEDEEVIVSVINFASSARMIC